MSKFTQSIENLIQIQKLQTELSQLLTEQNKIIRDLQPIIFSRNYYDSNKLLFKQGIHIEEEKSNRSRLYGFTQKSFNEIHEKYGGNIDIRHMVADLERLKELCE
jgi:hypothetical protein